MQGNTISVDLVHRRRAGGFSVIEILLAAALLSGILLGAGVYLVSGHRQSVTLDFRAAALQDAQRVIGRIQEDFSNLVPGRLDTTFAATSPSPGIELMKISSASGEWGLPLDAGGQLLVESISWRFDPETHQILRNEVPIEGAHFESVSFTFFPSRPEDPLPPHGDTLLVHLSVVPVESLGHVTERTLRTELDVALLSIHATVNHLHEDWVGTITSP
jgi:hypothetical protein